MTIEENRLTCIAQSAAMMMVDDRTGKCRSTRKHQRPDRGHMVPILSEHDPSTTQATSRKSLLTLILALSASALSVSATTSKRLESSTSNLIRVLGPQGVNILRLDAKQKAHTSNLFIQEPAGSYNINPGAEPEDPFPEFPAYYFEQPLDHFNATNRYFGQRYWVSTRHYTPGSPNTPVFVLDGGETSGEDRLPFLDTGIVDILTAATGGVGVILEHRYYGDSIPVTNLSTDSLRWLNNDQAAADSANFMANVKFPGIDEDLTAPGKPWIYYGGSYAGARAAHMRVLYPSLVFGAIASSGVTHATLSNWEYMDIIRTAMEPKCAAHLVGAVETIDNILAMSRQGGRRAGMAKMLKGLFGLASLEHDEDFVSLLESPLGSWQAKNWDPAVGSTTFDSFCAALVKPPFHLASSPGVVGAPFGDERRMVTEEGLLLDYAVFNYAKFIREKYVSLCPEDMTVEQARPSVISVNGMLTLTLVVSSSALGHTMTPNTRKHHLIKNGVFGYSKPLRQIKTILVLYRAFLTWRTKHASARRCAPSLSRGLRTLTSITQAFPPGEHFKVPALPNITAVNALGDFEIAADRLAIIDGEDGVHHYDEFGLRDIEDEPEEIRKIHGEMIVFVMDWLKQWKA
ncbi:hypothetical protein HWV62_16374 [Athelia sp. TMB]|nr:hypothetical protein HWV62_16374 [Athelia sp. TMB]